MHRRILALVTALVLGLAWGTPSVAEASCYTSGYYRSNGTYVSGYYRSCPDSTVQNNYTYSGNTNPYTYERGTNHYYNSPSSEWYSPSRSYGSSYSSYWP